jgi:uncharacterized protein
VNARTIRVTVVWATADLQDIVTVELPANATAGEAVSASRLADTYGVDLGRIVLGIAGRRVSPETALAGGDRVELCRPLTVDPKDARRRRAQDRPLPRPRPRQKRAPRN